MGPYCNYCDHRCFVGRVLPADSPARDEVRYPGGFLLMATCRRGMEHDRQATGYDHTTAQNPREQGASATFHYRDGVTEHYSNDGHPECETVFTPHEVAHTTRTEATS